MFLPVTDNKKKLIYHRKIHNRNANSVNILLQVYLTAWLAEVNIKWNRIEEILKMMNEEIQLTLPTKYS